MWRPYGSSKPPYATLHLLSESLMQTNQIRSWTFDSVRFPQGGQISLDLTTGKTSETTNSDLVFRWERLAATTNHDECGKFTICAPQGGVWLWEGERLFAPVEGYEKGVVFFFGADALRTYMKRRRAEFFVTSREGKVYARVFVEMNTENSSLSLRTRVNAFGSRFVDEKGGAYAIGVYGSLSPDYLGPDDPWWIRPVGIRGVGWQVIMPDDRLRAIAPMFPTYFAEHYQTPPGLLAEISMGEARRNRYAARGLASNLAAPPELLRHLKSNSPAWPVGKEVDSTLSTPEDLRQFLIARGCQ
jgi:hypothetical protein